MILGQWSPDAEEFFIPAALATSIKQRIAAPSVRDKQVSIGPSSLGDPCDHCVALTMSQMLPDAPPLRPQRFSLPPWIGTGVHLHLDKIFSAVEGWSTELKLDIGEIAGYGPIKGSTDAYHQEAETIVDWKVVGDNTLTKLRRDGLAPVYEYQRQLYGRGVERKGLPIRFVMNVYIPRNGQSIDDLKFEVNHYRPELAQEALDRAKVIWDDIVVPGKVTDAYKDPECYRCNGFHFSTGGLVRRAR